MIGKIILKSTEGPGFDPTLETQESIKRLWQENPDKVWEMFKWSVENGVRLEQENKHMKETLALATSSFPYSMGCEMWLCEEAVTTDAFREWLIKSIDDGVGCLIAEGWEEKQTPKNPEGKP